MEEDRSQIVFFVFQQPNFVELMEYFGNLIPSAFINYVETNDDILKTIKIYEQTLSP